VKPTRPEICIPAVSAMAELEEIAESLRRQREDLEDLRDSTRSRRTQTAELLAGIEDLRRRSEDTTRRFQASLTESEPKPKTK
jgi:septal ring factor EnvC (AmiA/AmiB activator)